MTFHYRYRTGTGNKFNLIMRMTVCEINEILTAENPMLEIQVQERAVDFQAGCNFKSGTPIFPILMYVHASWSYLSFVTYISKC